MLLILWRSPYITGVYPKNVKIFSSNSFFSIEPKPKSSVEILKLMLMQCTYTSNFLYLPSFTIILLKSLLSLPLLFTTVTLQ